MCHSFPKPSRRDVVQSGFRFELLQCIITYITINITDRRGRFKCRNFLELDHTVFIYTNEWGGKMKKRIGIYHYQYYRGACKLCYRHFIQEMVESYEKCHEVAEEIYGKENCEFLHYTDFGQYDSENTDRPSFRRIMEAIEKKELDVVMCYGLNNITINEELLIKFYKYVRSQGMEFLTADHGRDAMKYIDIYIEKNNL